MNNTEQKNSTEPANCGNTVLAAGVQLSVGDSIEIYDSCFQCNVIEKVVRIVPSHKFYNTTYIYSSVKNWMNVYEERLSTPDRIKRVIHACS